MITHPLDMITGFDTLSRPGDSSRYANCQHTKKLQAGSDWIELAVASLNNSWGILIFQVKLVIGL